MTYFGELLPYHDNKLFLNFDKKDKHGMPIITFDAKLRENEMNMRADGVQCAIEMLEAAVVVNFKKFQTAFSISNNGKRIIRKNRKASISLDQDREGFQDRKT